METGGGAEEERGLHGSWYPLSSSLSATTNMHANTHVDPTFDCRLFCRTLSLSPAPC